MYRMLYNDSFLFDPFDETRIVSSASITTNVNAASYLDFTIAATHPLYDTIEQRSGIITLYSDNEKLFQGQITSIDMDMDGNKSVTCSSALDWLKDVQLRPYSTDQSECNEYEFKLDKAPDALDAYFQWLIDQYNAQNKGDRYFTIKVNQAADLTNRNIVYFASTSPRSVADAIEEDILKTFGGYLILRYEDDQLILDLYSDIHEMNEQIIDYGENILDISRNESTDDQYTAVYPIGATPQYTAEQQKYHDEKDAYDEYMKQREATEKAAIDKLKKEEEAEQNRINSMGRGPAKSNAQDALKNRKLQRQAREKAFSDETKRLQDAQKIKDDKNNADKTKPNPITIESLNNGGYPTDLDIFKEGDVVYSVSYVARYGYKEFVYSESDVHDKNELLKLAVAKLKTLMAPMLTIDVRAVDQALYNPKHHHLFAGQAVRVRSKAHNVDEFMMVSSIDLDLIDPSQTTATLGVAYDTLTGQQSSFLRNLNSKIVASVDAVDKLGEDVKVTEITLGKVETVVENTNNKADIIINTVDDYKWMTDTAWGKADDAQEDADKANQGVTDTNIRIDNIKLATDERIDGMETDIAGIHTDIDNTKAEVEQAKQTAEQIRQDAQAGIEEAKQQAEQIRQDAQAGIEEAKQQAEDVRTEANTAIGTVKTDLAATEAKAELARKNASTALSGLSSANAQINGLRIDVNRHQENITNINGEIVGVKDTISGVSETANSALTVATANTHSIAENSSRIDTAYSDIEATRTSVSEVKQTADGLKVNLETNYLDKNAIGANYASKAELSATSESITSTVSKTYATKAALEGLQNIADAAIETWSGQTVPTASNPPASTWTTDALKRQHSGDIYYDMSTGKSYRWGSADGTAYSWSMIADSDITKAIADAAKAQQTADGAKQDVVNLSNDVKATYTSKSEFKQTSDEIKASVSEVASANETNAQKIAEVSVKADGISAKVEEQATTIAGHTTSIGQLSMKADGLQTKFEQVSTSLDVALANSEELLYNGGFEFGTDGWSSSYADMIVTSNVAHSGMKYARTLLHANELISTKPIKAIKGRRYRFGVWYKIGNGYTNNYGGLRLQKSTDGTHFSDWKNLDIPMEHTSNGDWRYVYVDGVADDNVRFMRARVAFRNAIDIFLDDLSIKDVTDAYNNAEKANTALTKTSQLEQSLDGFKQTVTESYLKKGDADTKYTSKSEFTQTANEIKGKITEQAETISGHTTTIGQLSLKADGLQTKFEQVSDDITNINKNVDGLINPAFASNSTYGWALSPANLVRMSTFDSSVNGPYMVIDSPTQSDVLFTAINNGILNLVAGHTYRVSIMAKVSDGGNGIFMTDEGMTIRFVRAGVPSSWLSAYANIKKSDFTTAWQTFTRDIVISGDHTGCQLRLASQLAKGSNSAIGIKSVAIEDITEGAKALVKTSELEQNLDGFKQTVSETYTTKDEFDNLQIGGRNLLKGTKSSKQLVGNNSTNQCMNLYMLSAYSWAHLEAGQYMLSVDMKYEGTISGTIGFMRNGTPWGFSPNAAINCGKYFTDSKRTVHFEFPIKNAYDGASNQITVRFDNVQGTVTFSNMKLERGTKATAWSPAPEDMLDAATASTTYTTKSEFTQTANEIRGQVSEQATTINGHTSTISTLSQKAHKFETDISQVTEQATAIAGRTTKLEQGLDGFKQTVSGTYITKTDAEQNLVDAINGMQIGGTNMLLDTRAFGSANPNKVPAHGFSLNSASQNGTYNQFTYRRIPDTVTTNNPDGPAYNNIPIERGKTYTASFYYRGTADLYVYFYGPGGYVGCVSTTGSNGVKSTSTYGNDGCITFTKDSEWKRYWVTWTLHATGGTNLMKYLLFRRKGSTGYIDIAGVKLEEGNKATEWSPSPFDTLYASTITSTYASKSEVTQTENRINSQVSATYATKTQLGDEMKRSLKTNGFTGRTDGNYWLKMGRVTMQQNGNDFHIDYTGGRGYNGKTSQNSQFEIHVRSSNGSAPYFGVTVNRLLNADMYQIKAFAVDATHVDLYMKNGSNWCNGLMAYYGRYDDFSGWTQIDDISTAEGTELEVFEQSLSSKSYVDQTANSVAIGVVEEYKNGEHGDKLTTQSNLTALKDEINASVSEQYADLSDQIKLIGSENVVGKNFSFESNNFDGWASHDRWEIGTNGAHTGRYYAQNTIPANSNGNQLISTGSIAAEYGHTYKLEYWVKKKPNSQCRGVHRISYKRSGVWEDMPSDVGTTMFLDAEGKTNINVGTNGGFFDVTDSWTKVTAYIIPPSNVTDIRVRIIGNNPGSAETVFAVDDVSLIDYSVSKTLREQLAKIEVKQDSITQTVKDNFQTLDDKIDRNERLTGGLKNPNFDQIKDGVDTLTGWSTEGTWARVSLSAYSPVQANSGSYFVGGTGTTAGWTLTLVNDGYIPVYEGMKLKIACWVWADANVMRDGLSIGVRQKNGTVTRNLVQPPIDGWKHISTIVTIPANVDTVQLRFGFVTTGTAGYVRMDSVSITDVTEADSAMQYAKHSESEWKQTAEGFTASIKKSDQAISAVGGSLPIINGGFESGDSTGWAISGFASSSVTNDAIFSNDTYKFVATTNGKTIIMENEGRIPSSLGDYIKVTARILVLNSDNASVTCPCRIGIRSVRNKVPYYKSMTIANKGWNIVETTIKTTIDGLQGFYLDFYGAPSGRKVVVDDVTMVNDTTAVALRTDLETRIAMTSNGVRVGKVVNDKFQGANVLMNADDGSFDILNGDEVRNRFTSESIDLVKNDTGYQFSIKPFTRQGTGSVATTLSGVNLISQGVFALNSIPATPASITIARPSGEVGIPSNGMCNWDLSNLQSLAGIQLNAKTYHDTFYADMDNGNPPASIIPFMYPVCRVSDTDGSSTPSTFAVMALCPATYILQGVWNASKPRSGVACDVEPVRRAWNSSNYVSCGRSYRFSETTDSTGWTTKGGPIWSVALDAGDRLAFKFTQQYGSGYKIGGGNFVSITRLPFSGQDMR